MTQKLTEEQQRSAHKIIKANRGDCSKEGNYLNCINCPNSAYNSGVLCFTSDFPERSKSPAFQAENLRRSQAWLDEHITDAEIMAESPQEFCERMVRTEGIGNCIAGLKNDSFCKSCPISVNGNPCLGELCFSRANAYLASHPATSQEPPKRRPKPDEMVVGATVRVRLWDELVRDGKLDVCGHILFSSTYSTTFFDKEMRQYCGTTHKVIKCGGYTHLAGCGDWTFIPEMLDYVEPKPVANAPKPEAKGDTTVKGDVDKLPLGLRFINFRDLLPVDALRIITLEGQVDDLTKKLAASTKLCERLQRRLRANWEAKRDEEMATEEEIVKWWQSNLGGVEMRSKNPKDWKVRPNGCTTWIPATRGNLKL